MISSKEFKEYFKTAAEEINQDPKKLSATFLKNINDYVNLRDVDHGCAVYLSFAPNIRKDIYSDVALKVIDSVKHHNFIYLMLRVIGPLYFNILDASYKIDNSLYQRIYDLFKEKKADEIIRRCEDDPLVRFYVKPNYETIIKDLKNKLNIE